MALNKNRQPARKGGASKQAKKAPAHTPKAAPQPKKRKAQEETAPGSIMWRMGLLLCTGLVVFSLLFASVNGGSKYVGVTEKEKATPTPPMETEVTIDPNLNVQGSDMTPIPPSASPEGDVIEGETAETPTP